jgi:hypothetical protein
MPCPIHISFWKLFLESVDDCTTIHGTRLSQGMAAAIGTLPYEWDVCHVRTLARPCRMRVLAFAPLMFHEAMVV